MGCLSHGPRNMYPLMFRTGTNRTDRSNLAYGFNAERI